MSEALDLIARGRDDAERIVCHFLGEPNRKLSSRRELRWRGKGSFVLKLDRSTWRDHESGDYGDPLDLIQREMSLDRAGAIGWLAEWFGGLPVSPVDHAKRKAELVQAEKADAAARQMKRLAARNFWADAVPIGGTLAEAYLRFRLGGAEIPTDVIQAGNLRWHPRPVISGETIEGAAGALIARMVDPATGEGVGVHRTFITPAARKVEKRMLGQAGVVCLSRFEDVTEGIGIGEGLESSLAVMALTGFRPLWAGLSAGAIHRFPVLGGIGAISIFSDNDAADKLGRTAGQTAAEVCAQRWAKAGREAFIYQPPQVGTDFGDIVEGRAA